MTDGIVITELGGACPVQAEGTIDGEKFYFRARGGHWSMGIGGDPVVNPMWYYDEAYGDGPFDAGYMDDEEAMSFIDKAAEMYRVDRRGNA